MPLPRRRPLVLSWVLGSVLAAAFALAAIAGCGGDNRSVTVAESEQAEGGAEPSQDIPAVAVTRNTSRIDGADPVEDAAEVALATHSRLKSAEPIEAVVVVDSADWKAGVAASVLAGAPLHAPILLSESGSVPDPTKQAIADLAPEGGSGPADAAAYVVGDAAVPDDIDATEVKGDDAAATAAAVDDLRRRLTGTDPQHIVLVSDADPAFAMPAAAWAARSGDPVLFLSKDSVPAATANVLKKYPDVAVYLLGPTSVASDKVLREVQRVSPAARRISGPDPVTNAIGFARYADASFGWNINDPGHGLVIANTERPADAAAAAPLSASGTYGPLLLIEHANELPGPLRDYLLDIKPGYREDPTRALYNRVWLIGNDTAISGTVQAELDDIAELAPIAGGSTADQGPASAPLPVGPSQDEEIPPKPAKGNK